MATAAILPLKGGEQAKSRLAPLLAPTQRAALAQAMAEDVLAALERCPSIERVVVVSGAGAKAVAGGKVEVLVDQRRSGQSVAVQAGVNWVLTRGFSRVICLPGDCPLLRAQEVEELLAQSAAPQLTVVPDRHGSGTNCLCLAPPDLLGPAFGPNSFARHLEAAVRLGISPRIARPEGLLLDVDAPADLEALIRLRHHLPRTSRTRAWLKASRGPLQRALQRGQRGS